MIDIDIVVLEDIEDTLPPDTDPLYQVAVTSMMIRKTLEALEEGGLSFQKPEISDFTEYHTNLMQWQEDAYAREKEIIKTGVSEIMAYLPNPLALGAAFISGGWSMVGALCIQTILTRAFGDPQATAANEAQSIEISESLEGIENKLQEISDNINLLTGEADDVEAAILGGTETLDTAIKTILTEHTVNIHSDKEDITYKGGRGSWIP